MSAFPWITALTLLPILGAALIMALSGQNRGQARNLSLGCSLLSLLIAVGLWAQFDPGKGMQFLERHAWIRAINVDYYVGVDGLGLVMVLLSALLVPFAILAVWNRTELAPGYFALFLLLESGVFGVFTALNFFHWFIFWELSLIPAFFLIKLWGGPQRSYAATQFFVYTLVGSVTMLLAFQAIWLATGSFDFLVLAEKSRSGELAKQLAGVIGWPGLSPDQLAMIIFLGVFLGLAVKVPLVPFHIWLPAAYAEAPIGASMVLTGLMSKMGVYGFLRILVPLFPQQIRALLLPLLWLAILTIIFSAWAALAQKDLKRTIAYSSINHLGYCLLGIFAALKVTSADAAWATEKAAALNGVILQMFNHGLSASALFCFVGFIEERSGGLRGLDDFGGLRKIAPVFCGLMGISIFSSLGLPGLNGFVGEFLIFKGAFALTGWAAGLSALGLLLTALFLLNILQRVFSGPLNERWAGFADLSRGELGAVAPIIALMFVVGIFPQIIIRLINPTVMQMVAQMP